MASKTTACLLGNPGFSGSVARHDSCHAWLHEREKGIKNLHHTQEIQAYGDNHVWRLQDLFWALEIDTAEVSKRSQGLVREQTHKPVFHLWIVLRSLWG